MQRVIVDLEPTLRAKGGSLQSAYGQLLDVATFPLARLDVEARTVCWDGLVYPVTTVGDMAVPVFRSA